jgi:hypothetical protein
MSRLPLTDRPHALLVDATIAAGDIVITAPLAILILAAVERESDAPAPGANASEEATTRPGLARCLPSNVVALPRKRTA